MCKTTMGRRPCTSPPSSVIRDRSRCCWRRVPRATFGTRKDRQTPLDLVSGPWSAEWEGIYQFLGSLFQMDLDIDRIKTVHPDVRAIL